jgi:hypothetical protein
LWLGDRLKESFSEILHQNYKLYLTAVAGKASEREKVFAEAVEKESYPNREERQGKIIAFLVLFG